MKITELNREQLIQVKQNYYTQKQAEAGEGVSYLELASIDELATDAEIFEEFAAVDFTPDDFTGGAST